MSHVLEIKEETTEKLSIEWTPYLASAYAEGYCEGENATTQEQLEAWAYLIKTGLCWTLQGWYGRMATDLINNNIISSDGEII